MWSKRQNENNSHSNKHFGYIVVIIENENTENEWTTKESTIYIFVRKKFHKLKPTLSHKNSYIHRHKLCHLRLYSVMYMISISPNTKVTNQNARQFEAQCEKKAIHITHHTTKRTKNSNTYTHRERANILN